MAPEVVIVGDPSASEGLRRETSRLGYRVEAVPAASFSWAAWRATPSQLLVVLASAEARRFLSSAMMSDHAPRPPVVLFGELGVEIRDLAELLELGADRLLSAPLQVEELRALLEEMIGPASRLELRGGGRSTSPEAALEEAPPRDPLLAQLKRTLASLAPAAEDDELDLREMGLTTMSLPGEGAADGGGAELDLSALEAVTRDLVRSSARPQSTVRLESSVDASAEARTAVVEPQQTRGGRPQRAAVSEPAPPLGEVGVATRLWSAHLERFTGLLRLSFGSEVLELWMVAGEPRFAASSRPEYDLIVRLHARGLLTSGQLAEAQRQGLRGTLDGGDALVRAGWLRPQELALASAAQLVDVITASFVWPRCSALLFPDARAPGEVGLTCGVLGLIVGGIQIELELEELWLRLGARDRRPRWIGASAAARRFGAGALEALVDAATLSSLDGRRSLAALAEQGGREALALICGLVTIGAVELLEEPQVDPVELVRARLRERLALVGEGADERRRLLGVARDASAGAIRRARRALLESFSPPLLEVELAALFTAELAALFTAIEAATAALLELSDR